jgi:signal peptidase II
MVAMHQRKPWLWGPLSLLGLSLAVTTIVLDQVHKWWMLGVFDIQNRAGWRYCPSSILSS